MQFMRTAASLLVALSIALVASDAHAYIDQADGTVIPQTGNLQACLNLPATGETMVGAVDAVRDAQVLPEAYRPVLDVPSGHYRVTFRDIAEGAGYHNTFGWFWVGTDVTNTANLHTIFGCRPTAGSGCACPCTDMTQIRSVTVDFDTQTGFVAGRPIGFWLRTPEHLDGTSDSGSIPTGCTLPVGCDPAAPSSTDSCGGRLDTINRIYFTSAALNDDGDYKHFLVYRSATHTNTYYFGFEDLFRGGDNDFEDMLVVGTGLVPFCDPRAEACDNTDNDCDGLIDEGVTTPCSTTCGAGTRTCTAGVFGTCSARVPAPSETVCDNMDDNCNGSIDEGLSRMCTSICGSGTEICVSGAWAGCNARTPGIETCNNIDDDCDGTVDDGLTRACATTCGSGIETCRMGAYVGCTAPVPGVETCNAVDDNCNGQVDEGLTRMCTSMCGMGTEVCVSGTYVGCTAPTPRIEACNGLDDDCDMLIDEDLMRACSSACGNGNEQCMAGSWVGCTAPTPGVETCNNLDDDCDGVVDDGNPGGGAACVPLPDGGIGASGDAGTTTADGGIVCSNGRVQCIDGALVCRGSTSGSREVCNCMDDDCDGTIDEEATGALCPGGLCYAHECQCIDPCGTAELSFCPPGEICDTTLADAAHPGGYCVLGMCNGVTCPGTEICNPSTGACEDPCAGVSCATGLVCQGGACVSNDCYGMGCPHGQLCRTPASGAPACVADPCASMTCTDGSYCSNGTCVTTCATGCRTDQVCSDGMCTSAPCDGHCTTAQSCVADTCVTNHCASPCGAGRVCQGTTCIDDACASVRCPSGFTCRAGACWGSGVGAAPVRGLAAGGGLLCSASAGRSGSGAMLGAILLALGIVVARKRRGAWMTLAVLGALGGGGCSVQPYCFTGCDDHATHVDAGDSGSHDGSTAVDSNVRIDGCVPTGTETCNDHDDDCNGIIDDGFNLETDPANCGRCGNACSSPHAFPACTGGSCGIDHCQMGWHDIDGLIGNGCEYACPPSGDEICDHLDNDCDMMIDEGIDLTMSLANCGSCGNVCSFPGADAQCVSSACVVSGCRAGFVDLDGMMSDGCEYRCTATGAEMCNGVDDDCNGMIDDGFNTMTDPMNCGTCGTVCSFPNATPHCGLGVCNFGSADCAPGYHDVNGNPLDGCEYHCTSTGTADTCDGIDQDCDGRVDEADPMIGSTCGSSVGACRTGTQVCVLGALSCSGDRTPTGETCNNTDDDCDGRTDESVPGAIIPGVGDRCGANNIGACRYGSVVCTAGALVCGGTLVAPTAETCNGIDDNCNGAVDDGVTAPPLASITSCANQTGVCAGRAATCRGVTGWQCDFPSTYQTTETICDTRDNDCDGTQDENCITPRGTDLRISTENPTLGGSNSLDPTITGTGAGTTARVHAAWRDVYDPATTPPRAHVFTTRSTDGGATFSAGTRVDHTLTAGGGAVFEPSILLTGATGVFLGWPDFRGGSSYREEYSVRSTDSGATFQPEVKINAAGGTATEDSYDLHVTSVTTHVFATWNSFTGTRQRHVFFAVSNDSGATWSTPIQLSTGTDPSFVAAQPRIAAAGTNVYVTWRDNGSGSLDVRARSSHDSGLTFAAEARMDLGTAAGSSSSFDPAIAASDDNAWVVWIDDRDGGSFDIWMNHTTDHGGTWLAGAVQLDQDPLHHDSIEPHVLSPATGVVLVGWLDYRFGQPDPYVTRSTDNGATFSAPARIDTGTLPGASASHDFDFAANGSLVAVVWSDARNETATLLGLDIYANFSLDQGANWQPQDYRLDSTAAGSSDSQSPRVWASTDSFHTVWIDHRSGPNGDIYYRVVR